MCFYVPSFYRIESFKKLNLYNVATPYNGTKFASPTILYPKIKNYILNLLGDTPVARTIYSKLIKIYESISSNSHMNYDIAVPGGISEVLNTFNLNGVGLFILNDIFLFGT